MVVMKLLSAKVCQSFLIPMAILNYSNGTCAKLAIYCGRIDNLEENIYPIVAELISKFGLNPADTILKYHGGNKGVFCTRECCC